MVSVKTSATLAGSLKADALFTGNTDLDYSGTCAAPVEIDLTGSPDKVLVQLGIERDRRLFVTIKARCRKCKACLQHRARLWSARACDELRMARRSWFGTLTYAPGGHVVRLAQARRWCAKYRQEDFDGLGEAERFRILVKQYQPDVTKFLKRVRRNSRSTLRYLLVAEAHKSGYPHFHLLVHELDTPVTKRVLEAAWTDGFSQFRLVQNVLDAAPAWYVCKYLTKSALTRVRASLRYGTPRVAAAFAGLPPDLLGSQTTCKREERETTKDETDGS